MKNKAFTLIELLAVIIILGILMLIAIPSVTNYINNSRKSTYVSTIDSLIKATIAKVNSGDLNMFDTDTTYYVPCTCIKLENGEAKSPYGKFDPAYVVVTFDGTNYNYYFTGKDVQNMGVPTLTSADILSKESIVANVEAIDTTVGIEGTTNVYVFSDECNGEGEIGPAGTTVSGGSSSGSGSSGSTSKYLCKRATTLHTGQFQYYSNLYPVTYGNTSVIEGQLNVGDAFDCDVNGDGNYDAETERFYYISDFFESGSPSHEFNSNYAVLIFFSNTYNGEISTVGTSYLSREDASALSLRQDSWGTSNSDGPITARKHLPTSAKWKNVKLKNTKRAILSTDYKTKVYNASTYTLPTDFSYEGYAARLLTIYELRKGCGTSYDLIEKCRFLTENLRSGSPVVEESRGFVLETPDDSHYMVKVTDYNNSYTTESNEERYGTRPVIDVPISKIEY